MSILKTFKLGGIHPKEGKLSANSPIKVFPLPKTVYIPVSQHIGAPATVLVAKGETVKTGQLIAKGEGFISANIHSSITGKVAKIDEIVDSSGYPKKVIVIDRANEEIWCDNIINSDPNTTKEFTPEEVKQKIREAGIVGLGGATFPSHVKMSVPEGKTAEYLIINAVECEPYLTSDHRLMLEKGDEILKGISIMMKTLNTKKTLIGIENNKKDAIEHLQKLSKNYSGVEVISLKVQYPQGGEKQLIDALIKKEVPSGKLPIEVGCVVQNVGTAFAVYEALYKNKPLIERVVTVTGDSVKEPSNFLVRIGTPIESLIEAVGGLPETVAKVVNGGPMMGKALSNLSAPVTKGTSGILLIDKKEASRKIPKNCIRCARCTMVCPMGLAPYLLENLTNRKLFESSEKEGIMDCIECGSCSYTCPANRALLDMIRVGKSEVNTIRSKRVKK